MPYVLVPHEPDVWLRARVEKQWRFEGRWRLSYFYTIDLLQFYRVYDADQCRPMQAPKIDPSSTEPGARRRRP